MECIPRPPPADEVDIVLPWNFKNSVFAPYKPDDDDILNQCFEFDWDHSKIGKILKDQEKILKIKAMLRTYYKGIREAFKYYGAVAPNGAIASIGTNVFLDLISTLDKNLPPLVDQKLLKMSDTDLEFVATNAGTKMNTIMNPDR